MSKKAKNLPVWSNELYFEKHRGTYTSHAPAKRMNRKCEGALREAEIWSVLAGNQHRYPQQELLQTWRAFLTTQFHDIIPGSSIPEVYDDAQTTYSQVFNVAHKLASDARQTVAGRVSAPAGAMLVFNSLSWSRTDVVRMTLARNDDKFHIVDEHDEIVPMQILGLEKNQVSCLFLAKEVPSLGYAAYRIVAGRKKAAWPINQTSVQTVITPFYKIKWNEYGQLERLYDREQEREVFGKSELGNVLETYLDYPNEWEAWDLDDDYRERPLSVFQTESVKVTASGPICTILRVALKGKESRITQDIYFYRHLHRIDFYTEVDWHERRTVLKAAFPIEVLSHKANYEIQFGALERSLMSDTSWEKSQIRSAGATLGGYIRP